jgi:hypothetical protein
MMWRRAPSAKVVGLVLGSGMRHRARPNRRKSGSALLPPVHSDDQAHEHWPLAYSFPWRAHRVLGVRRALHTRPSARSRDHLRPVRLSAGPGQCRCGWSVRHRYCYALHEASSTRTAECDSRTTERAPPLRTDPANLLPTSYLRFPHPPPLPWTNGRLPYSERVVSGRAPSSSRRV